MNGYKTYIGAALIGLGLCRDRRAITRFGEALSIGGLGHKLAKAVTDRSQP